MRANFVSQAEKPRSPGVKVKFLVEERVVRNVHLAIFAKITSVRVDDRRGIVVDSGRAPLEERGHDDHAEFLGERLHFPGRRPGHWLGQLEVFVILDLAEIDGAKEFLQADDLRALRGSLADATFGGGKVASRSTEHRLCTAPIITFCCDMAWSLPHFGG